MRPRSAAWGESAGLRPERLFRPRGGRTQRGQEAATATGAATAETGGERAGTAIAAATVKLTPEAQIATERYRCVCGCNDALSVCTCTQTPGSIDMKEYVQEQVNLGKSPAEIDQAMVEKYGAGSLLSNPAPPRRTGS